MYCPEIHHNLSIHYVNDKVTIGPCCIAKHRDVTNGEIINSEYLQFLKKKNNEGRLTDACIACTEPEKHGASSRRTSQLKFYKDWKGGIRGLDIHLGNLCNLKCVICGPYDSTSWHQDWHKLNLELKDEWKYDKRKQYDIGWLANLSDLEMVHFWGGEPLMGDAHIKFLKQLKKNDTLKKCRIQYNTNGTHRVTSEVLDLWSEAKLIEIYFSIDDIGERFNYQRTNADWDQVKENLSWFKEKLPNNHLLYVNTVWSYLNVYYLPELYEWLEKNFNESRSGDPINLVTHHAVGNCHVTSLSVGQFDKLRQKLKDKKFKSILSQIETGEDIDDRFREYIKRLDGVRNDSYRDSHPEWGDILGV